MYIHLLEEHTCFKVIYGIPPQALYLLMLYDFFFAIKNNCTEMHLYFLSSLAT